MRTQSASASGLKSSKDRAPQSAPASSASPVSSAGPNSQGADTSEYTEESEETRVRATPGARTSDAPESSAEMFTETGETFVPESDAATDSMLSRYFRDMATHQVMGPDEELSAAQAVEQAEIMHWTALLK